MLGTNIQWDEAAFKTRCYWIKSAIFSYMRDWFWMFRDTIPFKLSILENQQFGKIKMEFLNLLSHLVFHALLQSSLVDTRTLWCFLLVHPLCGPPCMAVTPVQPTNPSFSVDCMAPAPPLGFTEGVWDFVLECFTLFNGCTPAVLSSHKTFSAGDQRAWFVL